MSHPYVIFLPTKKRQILEAIFGSKISLDIIKFAVKQGISNKIYQRDLTKNLGHSNRSIIDHLHNMTELKLLEEHMEKSESSGRIVWLKSYSFSDMGKWFAFLLSEEKKIPREEKIEILNDAFRFYIRWVRELSDQLDIDPRELQNIFFEEMGLLSTGSTE